MRQQVAAALELSLCSEDDKKKDAESPRKSCDPVNKLGARPKQKWSKIVISPE